MVLHVVVLCEGREAVWNGTGNRWVSRVNNRMSSLVVHLDIKRKLLTLVQRNLGRYSGTLPKDGQLSTVVIIIVACSKLHQFFFSGVVDSEMRCLPGIVP